MFVLMRSLLKPEATDGLMVRPKLLKKQVFDDIPVSKKESIWCEIE